MRGVTIAVRSLRPWTIMSTATWKYSMHSGPIEVMISVSLATVWNQGNSCRSWCGTPNTYSRPWRLGRSAAVTSESGLPTASTEKSTISPPVSSLTRSTTSSVEASTTSVAPNRLDHGRRQATLSMPITWLAPIRPSRCVKISPIGPWPTTAHRCLMTGPVRTSARSTVASGCATTSAATSGGSAGSRASPSRFEMMYSANPL